MSFIFAWRAQALYIKLIFLQNLVAQRNGVGNHAKYRDRLDF